MSIPSLSYFVQTGAIAAMASLASSQSSPLMLELSSTRKMVWNSPRKAYWESVSGSSGALILIVGTAASTYGGGRSDDCFPVTLDVLELLVRPRDHDGKCVGVVTMVLDAVVAPALRSLRSFRWLDEKECHSDVFSGDPMAEDCVCFK